MSYTLDGQTYDLEALDSRLRRGLTRVPHSRRQMTHPELRDILRRGEAIARRRAFGAVVMHPGSHASSALSHESTHPGSYSSVGTEGWVRDGRARDVAQRMHRRERRMRRMALRTESMRSSGLPPVSTHDSDSSQSHVRAVRETRRGHYPEHRPEAEVAAWERELAETHRRRARRAKRTARAALSAAKNT